MPKNFVTISALILSLSLLYCQQQEQQVIEESVLEEEPILESSIEEPALESVEDTELESFQVSEEEIAEPAKAPPAPAAPRVSQEAPRFSESGRYVVQVSVFKSYRMAQGLENKFKKLGFPAYIATVDNPANHLQGKFYRLRIGPFASFAAAKSFGRNTLVPMNYDFWVDKKSGDGVGVETTPSAIDEIQELEEELPVEEETSLIEDIDVPVVEDVTPLPVYEEPDVAESPVEAPAIDESEILIEELPVLSDEGTISAASEPAQAPMVEAAPEPKVEEAPKAEDSSEGDDWDFDDEDEDDDF